MIKPIRGILGRLRLGTPGRVLAEIKLELLVEGLLTTAAGRVVAAVGEAALLELLLRWLLKFGLKAAIAAAACAALF